MKKPSLNGTVLGIALQTKASVQQAFSDDVADGVGIGFEPQLFEHPRPIGADGLEAQGQLRAHFLDTLHRRQQQQEWERPAQKSLAYFD